MDQEHVKRWWGPKDLTSPVCKIDLRVGGKYHFCMRSAEGQDFWNTGVYREIVEPERIVYTDSFADEKGNVVPATHYGMGEDFPLETLVTVTLVEHQGKATRSDGMSAATPARERFGRIAIANSDSGAKADTNTAIAQGWRAVQETLNE